MICFRCGEKNPDSYRFCGMCGGPLQSAKPTEGSDLSPSAVRPLRQSGTRGPRVAPELPFQPSRTNPRRAATETGYADQRPFPARA